jgi:NADH-quinone oxidoreductase subunit J
MTPETVQGMTFYFLVAIIVISCSIVVFARNIVHSVFSLFFTLLGVAGMYALLGADFLAVTQVIVYVGGILALLLFGILLTSRTRLVLGLPTRRKTILTSAVGLVVFGILMLVVLKTAWVTQAAGEPLEPTIDRLGQLLLGRYLFPFEFASLTLLAALVGAGFLVRRNDR